MPSGAKPGERRGGRVKGVPNKATIEKALLAERAVEQARLNGKKLGKERLEELMEIFIGATAYFQPTITPGVPSTTGDWDKFEKWARLAMECAAKLAPYQSPTFRAIVVAPPPAESDITKRFTLTIFEQRRQIGDGKGEFIEAEPVGIEDAR